MTSRRLASIAFGLLASVSGGAFAANSPEQMTIWPASNGLSPPSLSFAGTTSTGDVLARVAQSDDVVPNRYTWSATKTEDGVVLAGSVPNSAIQSYLEVRAGDGASDMTEIVRGGPKEFVDYSLAGLTALAGLSDGRVAYTGSKWTLNGHADSEEAIESITKSLSDVVDIADWIIFVEVAAPEAVAEEADVEDQAVPDMAVSEPVRWAVANSGDGLTLSGTVPNAALQSYLRVRVGEGADDETELGGVPPEGFINTAIAAIEAVKALDAGRVAYTGSKWTIGGYAPDQQTIESILENLGTVADLQDWVVFIEVTPEPVEETPVEETPAEETVPDEQAPAGQDSAAVPDFQFNGLKADGGAIALSGDVPTDAFGRYAQVIAGGESAGGGLTTSDGAPANFINDATAGIRALATLESGLLAYENGGWTLVGDALNDQDASAVTAAIFALPDGDAWTLNVTVLPAFELCADAVTAFSDTHTILFAPASSNLTAESAEALVELADDLKNCPAANLQIEGHTDADGPEDDNMALSVARAEAVIAELIGLGLDDSRLYAIGYGETLPVASNETRAGKAQNRRIVFRLVKE